VSKKIKATRGTSGRIYGKVENDISDAKLYYYHYNQYDQLTPCYCAPKSWPESWGPIYKDS